MLWELLWFRKNFSFKIKVHKKNKKEKEMRLLKDPKEILENVVRYAETADYIIGYNTKDSNIMSSGP